MFSRPTGEYGGGVRLERVLETVLYYESGQEAALARFYGELLGLRAVGRSGLTFRIGPSLLLLFEANRSSVQSSPPPHGAKGQFTAASSSPPSTTRAGSCA